MDLPEQVEMRETMHGSGAKGSAMYLYEDKLGLGVVSIAKRERSGLPFETTLTHKWMPGQEFNSYAALRIAASAVTDEMVAAEKAKWPKVTVNVGDHAANRCMRHRDRVSRNRAHITTCWIPMLTDSLGLCQECSDAVQADPLVAPQIMEERRAYVAALPPLRERLGLDKS